jgi:hypothetical protein
MVQVVTNLSTRESARKERFEPTGTISSTNVQKAIEEVASEAVPVYPGPTQVTAAGYVILPTDTEIYVNRAGAVTLTLPSAAAWFAAQKTAAPLTIKDISGASSTNNITINRAGTDTIDGATSFVITSDYGGIKLRPPSAAGNWAIVG